jgi:hypothetical protein
MILTMGLALLLSGAVSAQGAQGTVPVQTDSAASIPYMVYLPAVFRNYRPCTAVPTLISPANGTILTTITPLLVWDDGGDPNTPVCFTDLSKSPAFSPLVTSVMSDVQGQSQWRSSTNLSPSTTYYWRARLHCGSEYGPYTPVWTFTTGSGGTIVPAPILLAPGNGSGVPATTVTLRWSPVSGAVDYGVAWRKLGQGGYSYSWVEDTETAKSLLASTTYEWWVSARNDYAIGAASPKWQFTTSAGAPAESTEDANRSWMVENGGATMVFEEQGSK